VQSGRRELTGAGPILEFLPLSKTPTPRSAGAAIRCKRPKCLSCAPSHGFRRLTQPRHEAEAVAPLTGREGALPEAPLAHQLLDSCPGRDFR
jgi:hypothetical protein